MVLAPACMVRALEGLQQHLGAKRPTRALCICFGLSFTFHLFLATELRAKQTLDGDDRARGGGAVNYSKPVFEVRAFLERCLQLVIE